MSGIQLKAVIVDDEAVSRNVLREYLGKYCTGVDILGEAESVQTAIPLIRKSKPDIVFLDVEMPMGNGFDLLEQIGEVDFETVFVTAYDHYAIQALNFSAAYYLLKPVSIDELVLAVNKITKQRAQHQELPHARVLMENLQTTGSQQRKIVLPLLEGFEVVRIGDIVCCDANDNFTDFHFLSRSKMMICRSLRFYEELLSDAGFMRVHKSHLVNLDHVIKYTRGKGGILTLTGGISVTVSPQKKDKLLEWFEKGRK